MDSSRNNKDQQRYTMRTHQWLHYPRIVCYQKRKNINTRYQFIRELVRNGEVHLKPCKSSDQLADIFTKTLVIDVFEFHKINLGVTSLAET